MVGLYSRVAILPPRKSRRVPRVLALVLKKKADIERPPLVTHLGPVSLLWTLCRRWSSVRLQKTDWRHLLQEKQTEVTWMSFQVQTQESESELSLSTQQRASGLYCIICIILVLSFIWRAICHWGNICDRIHQNTLYLKNKQTKVYRMFWAAVLTPDGAVWQHPLVDISRHYSARLSRRGWGWRSKINWR